MTRIQIGSLARRIAAAFALFSATAYGASFSIDYRTGESGVKRAKAGAAAEGVLRESRIPSENAPAVPTALAVGDTLEFSLFDGATVGLTLTEKMASLSGADTFLAEVDGMDGMMSAVVMRTAEGLQADIQDCASGLLYKVASTDDGVTVREIRPVRNECDGCEPILPPTASPAGPPADGASCSSVKTASRVKASASGSVYVDILVAYDAPAATRAKTNSGNITNFAEFAVQKMNLAIANTGLSSAFSFRLVGVFACTGNAGSDLGNDGSAILKSIVYDDTTFNGYNWSVLKTERDRVKADVVSLLIDSSAYGTTGRGYSLKDEDVSSFSEWAYNVCSLAAVEEGQTMTHEVGHNMGAGHAAEMYSGPGPQLYDYSSGYYFTVSGTPYHTIMAYSADGYGNYYTGVPYFSSPNHKFKGVAVGNSTHDNTRTISETYLAVSKFRSAPVAVSSSVATAIGASSYTWTTSETYPWWNDGGWAASGKNLTGFGSSWIGTYVKGPATLSFQYYLRTYGGTFRVLCDGEELYSEYNVTDYGSDYWASEISIPSGTHEVQLEYIGNGGYFSSGTNGAEVKNLKFSGGTPVTMTTVTFDATGGSVLPVTRSVTKNSAVGTLPVPYRNLYSFDGWYTAESGGTKITASTVVSGNVTYYAHWTKLPYTFSGDADWTLQPDGSWRSGVVSDSCKSTISRTGIGPGTLTFKWKVSSEAGYDKLHFRVNGSEISSIPAISGETSWATVTYKVTASSTVKFDWSYERDSVEWDGQDCGWIKDVTWTGKDPVTGYTVQFHKYDGSGATAEQTFKVGETKSLLWMDSQLHWMRDGYEFVGWVPWNPDSKPRVCKYVNGQKVKD
ncbi:MAG: InlB B-repeat-containing protein, partial [Kiritimatiellae bacterium]|nr:InlB B-repeat-containing protein [Kiritimatiellia bacterium]